MNYIEGCIATDEVAEPLGVSAQRLNNFLVEVGVLKRRSHKLFLRVPHRGRGLETRKKNRYQGKGGETKYKSHLYWSYRGELYIHQLWNTEQVRRQESARTIQPELPLWGSPVTA
jgi:anti-repressor protein